MLSDADCFEIGILAGAGDGKQKNPLDAVSSLMANSGMDAGQLLQMASSLIGQPQGASGRKGSTSDRSPIIDLIAGYLGNFINVDSSLIVRSSRRFFSTSLRF